jgi:hypothetical protein
MATRPPGPKGLNPLSAQGWAAAAGAVVGVREAAAVHRQGRQRFEIYETEGVSTASMAGVWLPLWAVDGHQVGASVWWSIRCGRRQGHRAGMSDDEVHEPSSDDDAQMQPANECSIK